MNTPVPTPASPLAFRGASPTRGLLRSTGGFVLLASFALPALATPAMAADTPPVMPSGWKDVSTSGFDDMPGGDKYWWTNDGTTHAYTSDPEVNPAYLDLFYSTDQVSRPGDTVDFLVSLRRVEDYEPRPVEAPGVKGHTRTGFYGSLDLSTLVDDVEALRIEDFTGASDDLALLNLQLNGSVLSFQTVFPAGREVLTFRFSATYTGAGDHQMAVDGSVFFHGTHYQTHLRTTAPIRAVEPPLEIVKRSSRSEVTAAGQEVTYTIDVTRPGGNSTEYYVLTDDLSGLQDDVDPVPGTPVAVDSAPVTVNWMATSFEYLGEFGAPSSADVTQRITYTVRFNDQGDGSLVNSACVAPMPQGSTSVCATATTTARLPKPTATPTASSSPSTGSTPSPSPSAENSASTSPEAVQTPDPAPSSDVSGHVDGPLPQTGADSMTGWLLGAGAALLAGLAALATGARRGRHS